MNDNHTRRMVIRAIIICISLIMSARLAKQTYELLKVKERLAEEEAKVSQLAQDKEKLAVELQHKKSTAYIERQIRDKLHLSRPEDIVIDLGPALGDDDIKFSIDTNKQELDTSNWQKWLQVFGFRP